MENVEEKLGAILNNPQMMQQIMSMAQSLSAHTPAEPEQLKAPVQDPPTPSPDPALISKLMSFAGQSGIDPQQKALLHALSPYLTDYRISKLEKAMRAAKLANLASGILGSGTLSFLTGGGGHV